MALCLLFWLLVASLSLNRLYSGFVFLYSNFLLFVFTWFLLFLYKVVHDMCLIIKFLYVLLIIHIDLIDEHLYLRNIIKYLFLLTNFLFRQWNYNQTISLFTLFNLIWLLMFLFFYTFFILNHISHDTIKIRLLLLAMSDWCCLVAYAFIRQVLDVLN